MDQKQKWLWMSVMLALTFIYLQVVYPALEKKYHWKPANAAATSQPAPAAPYASTAPATLSSTNPTTGPADEAVKLVKAAHGPVSLVLGSTVYDPETKKDHLSPFPIGVTVTNRGAAVESVTLNRFRDQFDQPNPYVYQKPYDIYSPFSSTLATRAVSINGAPAQSLDTLWNRVDPTSGPSTLPTTGLTTASFYIDILGADGKPALRITKTFNVHDSSSKGAGYETVITHTLANLTGQPMRVKIAYNGTTSPKSENSRDLPEVVAGFDGGKANVVVKHSAIGSVKADVPLDVKTMVEDPLLWNGLSSAYFDAIVRQTDLSGNRLGLSSARAILLNPEEKETLKHSVALDYETSDIEVPANGSSGFVLNVYTGPKSRQILTNDYYAVFPLAYDQTLVLSGGLCGICTIPALINFLVWMLQGFHFLLRDWGLSIIALVCLVRLCLHPITKRSQISMSRMTKMGPEMERLKLKHKDDPDALKAAQVDFYKEQGVAPFLGCLPMFLQMPIWIALWSSLQSTFEIRHAPFLWGWTWIKDLSQPDRLFRFESTFTFWQFHIDAINILPVLMAVVFYIQQKFQPQPVAATPEQASQQKMMKWMSIFMFPLFLYGQPSGLNLYIFTSTLIGIIESKRVRDHIKERDEKEKAGVVIIDGPPGKRDDLSGGGVRRKNPTPDKPVGGLAGLMMKMQAFAEQAKQQAADQEKKSKKGKR